MKKLASTLFLFSGIFCGAFSAQAMYSESVIQRTKEANSDVYERIKKEAADYPKQTLTQRILMDQSRDPSMWEPYIAFGLDNAESPDAELKTLLGTEGEQVNSTNNAVKRDIKPEDLLFIIQEVSKPYYTLSKENAQTLFDKIIINRLKNPEKADMIVELLTTPCIDISGYTGDTIHANVLVAAQENYHLDALRAIFEVLPMKFLDIHTRTAVIIEQTGYCSTKVGDGKHELSYVDWLLRDKTQFKISTRCQTGSRLLLNYARSRLHARVDANLFKIATELWEAKALPSSFHITSFIHRVSDRDKIDYTNMSAELKTKLTKALESKK